MKYGKEDLRHIFQQPFSPEAWTEILHNLFKTSELRIDKEKIKKYSDKVCGYFLGRFTTSDHYSIGLFHYELSNSDVARKKVGLRKLVQSFINQNYGDFDAALVVFEGKNDWRLSFICDIKGLATAPKRFTFVFGDRNKQYKTAIGRFLQLQNSKMKFEDIKNAFSVESLSKDFYDRLFRWYKWAMSDKAGVTFPNNPNTIEDDRENLNIKIIRLITRLLFVWFIKQKHLVPDCLFSPKYLQTILKNFDKDSWTDGCYYNAILQNLFFATLNCPIQDSDGTNRSFASAKHHRDTKNQYRYAEMFCISETQVIELFAKVPFLNGGLFDCLDKPKDLYEELDCDMLYDGFSRNSTRAANGNYKYRAFVPNNLFFSEDEKQPGLITLFNEYNFTIEENSTDDAEISLDPELLGRVFENLLAAYNPETRESVRKSTGSFYTPRVIVDYMVDEALIAFLMGRNITGVDKDDIRQLFQTYEKNEKWGKSQIEEITKALEEIKILDPACGSGAFPMGCLLRIVEIIEILHDNKINRYKQKLTIIEKCIYGGDIQSIAMLICKLRFFISLICEQKDEDIDFTNPKDNYGVNPLPNLETKFVAVNSLISAAIREYNNDWTADETLKKLNDQLLEIRKQHFQAKGRVAKRKSQEADKAKRKEIHDYLVNSAPKPSESIIAIYETELKKLQAILDSHKGKALIDQTETVTQTDMFGNNLSFSQDINKRKRDEVKQQIKKIKAEIQKERNKSELKGFEAAVKQITDWNPYDQNSVSPFFDPEWMFCIDTKFDIVIGNPPYISTKDVSDKDKIAYEKEFGFSDDTYNLFTFKGLSLCKNNGSLTYIISKTFWTTQTKRNMRELLLENTINYIFDTANPFEAAMVDTCIIQVRNSPMLENHQVCFLDGSENLTAPLIYKPILQKLYVNAQNKVIFKPTELNLRIYDLYNDKVKTLYEKWWDKIKTSRDIEKNKEALEAYRKSLKPGDVALLGCLTEGGQGLATANNGKYIAVRRSTKRAAKIIQSRPKMLADAIKKNKIILPALKNYANEKEFLASLSEKEIAQLFDSLKEKYGRDVFGQGYLYRIIEDSEISDVDSLSKEEKENGIDTSKKYYVPYDKGDKDGNRWYLETPFAIAWSKENVRFLKTNSGKKGEGMPVVRNSQFYFREGFCWNNVLNPNARLLKTKVKGPSVNDVGAMSLYPMGERINSNFYIAILNSNLIFDFYREFINCSVNIQINDLRLLPIVIPNTETLQKINELVSSAIANKRNILNNTESKNNYEQLAIIEVKIDKLINNLYLI